MIYILRDSVMNGTVTMNTYVTGIEADSFPEAIKKVKELPGMVHAIDITETIDELTCKFENAFIITYSTMNSTPLKVI